MFRFTGLALIIGFLIFMFAPSPGFAAVWLFPAGPVGLLLDGAFLDVEW
jgi:hypothetical protein